VSVKSYHRGHLMIFSGAWRWADTGQPVAGHPRPCGKCKLSDTPEGHDGCLGTLPGVRNACCGHGYVDEAYVSLDTGIRLGGAEALEWIQRVKC
jgi:hypothetical protein